GYAVAASNGHYGSPANLILPSRAAGMHDGWETARDPHRPPVFALGPDGYLVSPHCESCVFRMGLRGVIDSVHVDTEFFKGNYPESCLLQGTDHPGPDLDNADWFDIVPRSRLTANALHSFESSSGNPCTHVKLSIFPDGGVSRLRVFGYIV
ncbi:allantoicase, partial [Synchytrium endobioticum]